MNTSNGTTEYAPGTRVRLYTPDNVRLHAAAAVVDKVEAWGCHVLLKEAASGRFRAAWCELRLEMSERKRPKGKETLPGATGDVCPRCGSINMIRAGTCACCQDCGETTGCS